MSSTIMWLADNLNYLRTQAQDESVDLIYIDPPFNSKRNYNIVFNTETDTTENAFSDIWSNVRYLDELDEINRISPSLYHFLKMLEDAKLPSSYLSYLTAMAIRCYYMRRMLKSTGCFVYHCDPTMSHYVKVMLDYIFGVPQYQNEITWCYTTSGKSKTSFPKKHDTLLVYSKTQNNKFKEQRVDCGGKNISRYNKIDADGTRYYMRSGKYKVVYTGTVPVNDWWTDIPALTNNQSERLGYPTQKPEQLLFRILDAYTDEGDVVADFYLGGGTTAAAAYKLQRDFLGTDINYRAIQITKERLESLGAVLKKDLLIYGIPTSASEMRRLVESNILGDSKNSRMELEDIVVKYYLKGVVGNDCKTGDNSIDGQFGFVFEGRPHRGLVQVTSGSNKNHLKAFCSEIGKGTGDFGVYITFRDCVTDGFIREVKSYGKLGDVDRIQILSLEDLIDTQKTFVLPSGAQ